MKPRMMCGKILSFTVAGCRYSTKVSICCRSLTRVARSGEVNSLTTHGTILFWYSSGSKNFPIYMLYQNKENAIYPINRIQIGDILALPVFPALKIFPKQHTDNLYFTNKFPECHCSFDFLHLMWRLESEIWP